jgi:AraC-like DNA-binding protein
MERPGQISAEINNLTQWRMMLAKDRLTNSRDTLGTIANGLGYDSENAFSTAFRRVVGCSPRRYAHTEVTK